MAIRVSISKIDSPQALRMPGHAERLVQGKKDFFFKERLETRRVGEVYKVPFSYTHTFFFLCWQRYCSNVVGSAWLGKRK